jgi:chromosome segregation ATPase
METTLLDIQIPVEQIKAATAAIGEARKSLEALREEQKNLDKGSEAYTKNAIKIKELNAEIRTNERVVMANTKAQQANQGSIEQLRAQLSQVTDQWSKLSKEERENTDAGQKLVAQKLKLTEELKRLEKQTGDTRRNVGNYSEGVKEALMQTGAFSNQFALLARAQTAWNAIVALSNGALKSFRIALISTGIGAIVVAIGSLIAAFASTQQGVDTLNKFLKPLQFAFQRLIGVFQDVAIALSKLNFKEVWNQIRGIGGAMRQAAVEGYQYAESQVALKKAQLALAEAQGELNRKFQEQKAIVQDVTKSDKERKAAADEALAALDARTQLEANILKEQIKQAELSAKQNDTDYETQIELANLKGQLAQLEADRVQKSLEIRNQVNGLDKAAAAARLKEAEELAKAKAKADEEAKKKAEKEKEELEKRIEAELKMELEAAERLAQEKINIESQRLLNGEITVDEFNKRMAQMEMEALEARKAVLEQFGQDTLDINSEILAAQVANAEAQIETDKIAEETKRDQKEKTLEMAISTLGEQTLAGKVLSSAQAAINSYEAATLALATIPPPLGQIQAALTVIQGLAQVARINAVPIPKFATGVIGIDGPGTGTSDSITAKISAGESVMTAKATAKYAPLLASLERSVGNNPNIGKVGKAKFANGVISAGINATRQAAQVDGIRSRELAVALKNQPIFVSLTELDTEQVRFNQARAVSVVE